MNGCRRTGKYGAITAETNRYCGQSMSTVTQTDWTRTDVRFPLIEGGEIKDEKTMRHTEAVVGSMIAC